LRLQHLHVVAMPEDLHQDLGPVGGGYGLPYLPPDPPGSFPTESQHHVEALTVLEYRGWYEEADKDLGAGTGAFQTGIKKARLSMPSLSSAKRMCNIISSWQA